jgi:hypothetical protein
MYTPQGDFCDMEFTPYHMSNIPTMKNDGMDDNNEDHGASIFHLDQAALSGMHCHKLPTKCGRRPKWDGTIHNATCIATCSPQHVVQGRSKTEAQIITHVYSSLG